MEKYIKTSEAKQSLYDYLYPNSPTVISLIDKAIDSTPSADVAEVRHGKWIDTKHGGIHGDTIYRCSACGNEREAYIDEENYCPNCGAKMDGEGK